MPLSAASPLQLQRQYLREPWLRARHTTSETSNLGAKGAYRTIAKLTPHTHSRWPTLRPLAWRRRDLRAATFALWQEPALPGRHDGLVRHGGHVVLSVSEQGILEAAEVAIGCVVERLSALTKALWCVLLDCGINLPINARSVAIRGRHDAPRATICAERSTGRTLGRHWRREPEAAEVAG